MTISGVVTIGLAAVGCGICVPYLSSRLQDPNLLFGAQVIGAVVGIGTVIAGAGYLIEAGGARILNDQSISNTALRTLGDVMHYGGRALFLAGKYTAYTALVPTYIACYKFPLWLHEVVIPHTVVFLRDYVAIPLFEHVLRPAFDSFISIIERVAQFVRECWQSIRPVLERVLSGLLNAAQWTMENLIDPIFQRIQLVWEQIEQGLVWIIRNIYDFCEIAYSYVVFPIEYIANKIASFINRHLLPLLVRVAQTMMNLGISLWQWTYDYILDPALTVSSKIVRVVWKYFFQSLYRLTRDYLIVPLANLAISCVQWTNEHLIEPITRVVMAIFNLIAEQALNILEGITNTATFIYDQMVTDLFSCLRPTQVVAAT